MANNILSASPFSRNDIHNFAKVIEAAFHHYTETKSYLPMATNYLRALRSVVGLGFTAVLVEGDLLLSYQIYLERFIELGHVQLPQGAHAGMAQAVAEMVEQAFRAFYYLGHPPYFEHFKEYLHTVLSAGLVHSAGERGAAESLMKVLKSRG